MLSFRNIQDYCQTENTPDHLFLPEINALWNIRPENIGRETIDLVYNVGQNEC